MNEPDPTFALPAGDLAHGHDFGRAEQRLKGGQGRESTPEGGQFLLDAGKWAYEECEEEKAAIAFDELDETARRTLQEGLVDALTSEDGTDWLGIRDVQLHPLRAAGEGVAFVCDSEMPPTYCAAAEPRRLHHSCSYSRRFAVSTRSGHDRRGCWRHRNRCARDRDRIAR